MDGRQAQDDASATATMTTKLAPRGPTGGRLVGLCGRHQSRQGLGDAPDNLAPGLQRATARPRRLDVRLWHTNCCTRASMSTACTGLLILGMCVPLPGNKQADFPSDGWTGLRCGTTLPDEALGWQRTSTFPAWRGRLVGYAWGTNGRVDHVHLLFLKDELAIPALAERCSSHAPCVHQCQIAGRRIMAEHCEGVGWLLSTSSGGQRDAGVEDWCARYGQILRSARPSRVAR